MPRNNSNLRITVAAGTYDGILAGWELRRRKLVLSFASPVHGGSVRGLSLAASSAPAAPPTTTTTTTAKATAKARQPDQPASTTNQPHRILVSCGYDESIQTHDFSKRLTSSGQLRTPADFGTPSCLQFAPPYCCCESAATIPSTHCLVGFSSGKLVIYKKKDWSLVHVLAGHVGGVSCLAVHPSGKLALTGGRTDAKLQLWDLLKGRLAFCHKIPKLKNEAVETIVWNSDGSAYGFCYGKHVTVRDVDSGKDLLDVELPSRANQICFLQGLEGLFVVVAGNDGSLAVLKVGSVADKSVERRAIMAIEPVDSTIAGEERFKCLQSVTGYIVATANSAGVVSVMDLQGAVTMICEQPEDDTDDDDSGDEEIPVDPETDDDDDQSVELAVDLIDSIQLGTGARITCLAAWADEAEEDVDEEDDEHEPDVKQEEETEQQAIVSKDAASSDNGRQNRKRPVPTNEVVLSEDALERARVLVSNAKKIQQRKEKKRHKKRHEATIRK
jgi:protein MAK11